MAPISDDGVHGAANAAAANAAAAPSPPAVEEGETVTLTEADQVHEANPETGGARPGETTPTTTTTTTAPPAAASSTTTTKR